MKKKRSDLITEGIREKMNHDSWDHNEEFGLKRSKWRKWVYWIIGILILIVSLIASIMSLF